MGSLTAQWWKELHDTDMTIIDLTALGQWGLTPHGLDSLEKSFLVTEKKSRPQRSTE